MLKLHLFIQALWELARYDVVSAFGGFQVVHRELAQLPAAVPAGISANQVCTAVARAISFYWRPVHCLQRSAATVRLLRKRGIPGRLVIGYRAAPFFSHAWVEVEGLPVNDSSSYRSHLQVLETV